MLPAQAIGALLGFIACIGTTRGEGMKRFGEREYETLFDKVS